MLSRSYKIGILSTAYIAHNGIIRPSNKREDTELYSIASRSLETAHDFASKHKIPNAYGSYQELIDDPEVDIIYICPPNHLHYEWTKKSLLAGKHVLCEKPLAPSIKMCKELEDLAKEKKLMLADGMHYRYYPMCKEFMNYFRRISNEINSIDIRLGFPLPSYPNIRLQPECLGGAFMHLTCYLVDSLFNIFPGKHIEVESMSSKYFRTGSDLWTEIKYNIESQKVHGKVTGSFLEDNIGSYFFVNTVTDKWMIKHFFDPTVILGEDILIDQVKPAYEVYMNGQRMKSKDYDVTTYDCQLDAFMRNVKVPKPQPQNMINSETCGFISDCMQFLYKPNSVPDFHC